ncbi:hypothetical protein K6119_00335 [Paracrocinitomix mangrovi]|uniref:hypothetical protein n=1 Tax=Paracrocinitomix mangrovi TaxID=2862509 RepID=UPI001C8EB545|nr:hypothetical protein [Paracrocinitomix mangrovi]UKN01961.1 hypothetical protein K6119_00335 [Paracrocinitomix mangrovi]
MIKTYFNRFLVISTLLFLSSSSLFASSNQNTKFDFDALGDFFSLTKNDKVVFTNTRGVNNQGDAEDFDLIEEEQEEEEINGEEDADSFKKKFDHKNYFNSLYTLSNSKFDLYYYTNEYVCSKHASSITSSVKRNILFQVFII